MNRPMLSDARIRHLHGIYQRGYSIMELAEVFGLPWYPIWSGFHRLGLKVGRSGGRRLRASIAKQVFDRDVILPPERMEELRREFLKLPKCRTGCRGYPERFVQAIYSDYRHHENVIAPLAARWNRAEGTIGLLLSSRGLRDRDRALAELVLRGIYLQVQRKKIGSLLPMSSDGADHFRKLQPERVSKIAAMFALPGQEPKAKAA